MSERVKRETSKRPKLQIMRITWRSQNWRGRGHPLQRKPPTSRRKWGNVLWLGVVPPSLSLTLHSISRNQPLPSAIPVECFDLQANHKNKCIKSNGKSMEPTINCVDGIARGLYKLFYCSNNTKEFGCPATSTTTTTTRVTPPLSLSLSLFSSPHG